MRALLVGAGSIGKRHLGNLKQLGCHDVVVYRTRREGSAELEATYQVRCAYDLDQILDQGVDLAIIANPTSLHIPVALKCVHRGCHLYIEKPLSDRMNRVDELVRLAAERRVKVMVGYNLRFHPVLCKVGELLGSGAIGQVYNARAWVGQYLPDWHPGEDYRTSYMVQPELGGGVIHTLSHELHYLYWLLGPVSQVSAVTASVGLEMATETLAEITLIHESGVIGHVHLDCLQRTPSRGAEFIGEMGTLRCDLLRGTVQIDRPGKDLEVIPISMEGRNSTYTEAMQHFLDSITADRQPCVSLRDGVSVMQIALAAHRSATTGARQSC